MIWVSVSDALANDKNKETDARYFIGYKTGEKIIALFTTFSNT